jgi:hypothetical protein
MTRQVRFVIVSGIFLIVLFSAPYVLNDRPETVPYWERMRDGWTGYSAFALIIAALVFGVLRLLETRRRLG